MEKIPVAGKKLRKANNSVPSRAKTIHTPRGEQKTIRARKVMGMGWRKSK